MQFESLAQVLDMGGHGLYVWLSFGIGLAVIIFNLLGPVMKHKQIKSTLRRRFKIESRNQ